MGSGSTELQRQVAPALSRRERKKGRTRREIYEAALSLFAENGFDSVTVEQICDAADVARGTFFAHFPTKASLLFEYDRETAAKLGERLRDPRQDAEHEFRVLASAIAERWRQHGDVMRSMLRALLSHPEEMLRAASKELHLAQLISEVVERGQLRGELRSGIDPDRVAVVFLASSLSFLSGVMPGEPALTPEEVRGQLLDLVLHGVARDRARVSPSGAGEGPEGAHA